MRILVFDNYDSFTYNLVHLVEKLTDASVDVFLNDKIGLDEIANYDKIILSPGPGLPKDAGLMPALIKNYASEKSILGVCLGHQAIGEAFGATLVNLQQVYHGVSTEVHVSGERSEVKSETEPGMTSSLTSHISHSGESSDVKAETAHIKTSHLTVHLSPLFQGLPTNFEAGLYHSWIVSPENFPGSLEITAIDKNGIIMGLQHKTYDLQGVQFHPESIMTPAGEAILRNWLKS
jgi:anthranilate synthase component 2